VKIGTDLRKRLGPARDQGTRQTCLAFALSDLHAAARASPQQLSPEHLYWHAVQRSVTKDAHAPLGISVAVDALREDGQCVESGWPYMAAVPTPVSAWKPPTTATPALKRASTVQANTPSAVCSLLDHGKVSVLGIRISTAFYQPNADGQVLLDPSDSDTTNHAVVAVAYGHEGGCRFILVRNSWGLAWGLEGHAWLAEDYLSPRLLLTIET
jgi:hypothetical protein